MVMQKPLVVPRTRYPWRAKVAVATVVLFSCIELGGLALFMLPLLPLVPVFLCVVFGNAFVLADVVHWAASLGSVEPVRVERAETAGKIGDARPAHAAHAV
jgi:hypothetical protein